MPLAVRTPEEFVDAAKMGDLACVQHWLRQQCLPQNDQAALNWCTDALEYAAEAGHGPVVEALLSWGDVSAHGFDALFMAAYRGHADVVHILLPSSTLAARARALEGASQEGRTGVVDLLMPLCDPQADNSSALQWAAERGHAEVVRRLLPVSDLRAAWRGLLKNDVWPGLDHLAPLMPMKDLLWALKRAPPDELPQARARVQADALARTLVAPGSEAGMASPERQRVRL